MTQIRAKKGRLRLDPSSYRSLWEKVLTRDGWRCQVCGSYSNLQVHHIRRRSSLGNDEEENLITLCVSCHRVAHGQ
jgi:5-methylcytosine-specific restriction endonuclease McrA